MIRSYRSRPKTVVAVRWLGEENCAEVFAFIGQVHTPHGPGVTHWLDRPNGGDWAGRGDWIVRLESGRFEVLTDDEFRAEYDVEVASDV